MREIAALNALPEIKDRTRLIIGNALAANLRYSNSWPYWREDWIGDSIFMYIDPIAHDTMGLQLLTRALEKDGGNPASLIGMAAPSCNMRLIWAWVQTIRLTWKESSKH